jgi:glutaminyl-tRNA synthetase
VPEKGFKRLSPGSEVRLRAAYIIQCTGVEKDAEGQVAAVRCSYDPETKSGLPGAERKVKGVIHWVSARHALTAEVRLYDRLISVASPSGGDWKADLNPNSSQVLTGCQLEPSLAAAKPEERFQFERQGYFCADLKDSRPGRPVFNRTVTLRDSWVKK